MVTTSAESQSLFTAPDTCSSQLNVRSNHVSAEQKMIQDANTAVGITTSRDEGEALFSSSLEGLPLSSPLGDSVPATSKHLTGSVPDLTSMT